MRRRRRQSTQLIKRKYSASQKLPQHDLSAKSRFKWKRWLRFLFFFIVVVVSAYLLYTFDFSSIIVLQDEDRQDTVEAVSPVQDKIAEETLPPLQQNIQIEVLNGCGVNGIAKVFQSYLREQGFDVVNTENYIEDGKRRWDIEQSMIIDHIGDTEQAKALARSLGIAFDKIIIKQTPNPIYEISVVIGKDYQNLNALK